MKIFRRAVWFPVFLLIAALLVSGGCKRGASDERRKRADSYYMMGVAAMNVGDATTALEQFLKAIEINPNDARYHDAIGQVYYAKERFDKAIYHFKQALAIDPEYADAHHNLGTVYVYLGRYSEAESEFNAALANDLFRNRAASINSLGWCRYKTGDFVKAEEYLQQTIKMDRRYLIAYNNLGLVYIAMDRGADAVEILRRVLELSPDYIEAHLSLGIAYTKIGQVEQAKSEFARVIELDPYGKLGSQAKQYLRLLRGESDGEVRGLP